MCILNIYTAYTYLCQHRQYLIDQVEPSIRRVYLHFSPCCASMASNHGDHCVHPTGWITYAGSNGKYWKRSCRLCGETLARGERKKTSVSHGQANDGKAMICTHGNSTWKGSNQHYWKKTCKTCNKVWKIARPLVVEDKYKLSTIVDMQPETSWVFRQFLYTPKFLCSRCRVFACFCLDSWVNRCPFCLMHQIAAENEKSSLFREGDAVQLQWKRWRYCTVQGCCT